MAFRGEMDDGVRLMALQEVVQQGTVADGTEYEPVVGIVLKTFQGIEITGVGEGIQVDDACRHEPSLAQHEIASDKTGSTGDQKGLARIHKEVL